MQFKESLIETPLGPIRAVGDERSIYLIEFIDQNVKKKSPFQTELGKTKPIEQLEHEFQRYFAGHSIQFKTPLYLEGTSFQKRVWEELQKIPHGKTKSYAELAKAIDNPLAYRAVGLANGANPFVIVIPCHRVINNNGELGGYAAGIQRKEWLLKHEKK